MTREPKGAVWAANDELVGSAMRWKDLVGVAVYINAEEQEYLLPLQGSWRSGMEIYRDWQPVGSVRGDPDGAICSSGFMVASQVVFVTLAMTLWRQAEAKEAVIKGAAEVAQAVVEGLAEGAS